MKTRVAAALSVLLSSFTFGCGYGNPVVNANMKKLDQAHKAAMATDDLTVLRAQAEAIRAATVAVREQSLQTSAATQALYDKGLGELADELSAMDSALAAGDAAAAKAALTRMTDLRKKYHIALGL